MSIIDHSPINTRWKPPYRNFFYDKIRNRSSSLLSVQIDEAQAEDSSKVQRYSVPEFGRNYDVFTSNVLPSIISVSTNNFNVVFKCFAR